jgi:site-specific DNA recombinase
MHYREGSIRGIVIYSLDRLSRSPVHLAILLQEMEQYHVTLYVAHEKFDETTMGKFLLMLLVFLADMEREKALDSLLNK